LSNFNSEQIQRVLDVATVRPLVNQVSVWKE
jgi:diketogulonate reductase-like aldo/keto reductase